MMMIVDVSAIELNSLQHSLNNVSEELGLKIHVQLEETFQAMHRV